MARGLRLALGEGCGPPTHIGPDQRLQQRETAYMPTRIDLIPNQPTHVDHRDIVSASDSDQNAPPFGGRIKIAAPKRLAAWPVPWTLGYLPTTSRVLTAGDAPTPSAADIKVTGGHDGRRQGATLAIRAVNGSTRARTIEVRDWANKLGGRAPLGLTVTQGGSQPNDPGR